MAGLRLAWSETPMTGFLVTWLNLERNWNENLILQGGSDRNVDSILMVWFPLVRVSILDGYYISVHYIN